MLPHVKWRFYYTKSGGIDEGDEDMGVQDWEAICKNFHYVDKDDRNIAHPSTWRPADGGIRSLADKPKNTSSPMGKKQRVN
jgi:hypothetical protein